MTADNAALDRVRKLLAKAEAHGVTPAEAEALTAKAAELMARYGIDRALLAATQPETDQPADRIIHHPEPVGRDQGGLHPHAQPGTACGTPGFRTAGQLLALRGWAVWCVNEMGDNSCLAITIGQHVVADREQVLGPDHPDTLGSRNNLAGAYEPAGRLAPPVVYNHASARGLNRDDEAMHARRWVVVRKRCPILKVSLLKCRRTIRSTANPGRDAK